MRLTPKPDGTFNLHISLQEAARLLAFFTTKDVAYLEYAPGWAHDIRQLLMSRFPNEHEKICQAYDVVRKEDAAREYNLSPLQQMHAPDVLETLAKEFPGKDIVRVPDGTRVISCGDCVGPKRVEYRPYGMLILSSQEHSRRLVLAQREGVRPFGVAQCPLCGTVYYALPGEPSNREEGVGSCT